MIIIHEGVPGSGKTYDAVRKINDALKLGRSVYHNIRGLDLDLCQEAISAISGLSRGDISRQLVMLTDDHVREFWLHCPDGAFIVIDEAQLYFNSRDFNKGGNRAFGDWASTHRHHGFDLLLISQRAERIETSVRSLAEFRYRYRKLNVFGSLMKKGYLVYSFAGGDSNHLAIRRMTYDAKIFACYQSYAGDNTEKKAFKNPNILNHPIFYLLGISIIGALYFVSQSSFVRGDIFDISGKGAKPKKISTSQNNQTSPKLAADKNLESFKTAPALTADGTLRHAPGEQEAVSEVWIPLDVWLFDGSRFYISSRGVRIKNFLKIDKDNMMALVKTSDLPPRYMLLDEPRHQDSSPDVPVGGSPEIDKSDIIEKPSYMTKI